MASVKVSISLPQADVEFLDGYAHDHGLPSRSAALHSAVGALRAAQLGDAYEDAWAAWAESGAAAVWDAAAGDGLDR